MIISVPEFGETPAKATRIVPSEHVKGDDHAVAQVTQQVTQQVIEAADGL
jgi:hypothetical protein